MAGNPTGAPCAAVDALFAEAQACRRCPRMEGRRRVLGPGNGPLRARAIIVGTAPGRLGADRTGIPFSGDRSGAMLDRLLLRAGLRRDDVFITNAVLCNPRDGAGRNAEPLAAELQSCSGFLAATLQAVDAPLVIALGATALRAVLRALHITQAPAFGVPLHAGGRTVIGTFHPSPLVSNQPARRVQLLRHWDAVAGAAGHWAQ